MLVVGRTALAEETSSITTLLWEELQLIPRDKTMEMNMVQLRLVPDTLEEEETITLPILSVVVTTLIRKFFSREKNDFFELVTDLILLIWKVARTDKLPRRITTVLQTPTLTVPPTRTLIATVLEEILTDLPTLVATTITKPRLQRRKGNENTSKGCPRSELVLCIVS